MTPLDIVSVMCHPSHAEAPYPKGMSQQAFHSELLGHSDAAFKKDVLWDEAHELGKILIAEQLLTLRLGSERQYEISGDGVFLHYISKFEPFEEIFDTVFKQTGHLSADFARAHLPKLRDLQRRVRFARDRHEQAQVTYRIDWLPPATRTLLAAKDTAALLKMCQGKKTGLFGLWG